MFNPQATSSSKAIKQYEAIENPISIDLIEPHLYLGSHEKIKTNFMLSIKPP